MVNDGFNNDMMFCQFINEGEGIVDRIRNNNTNIIINDSNTNNRTGNTNENDNLNDHSETTNDSTTRTTTTTDDSTYTTTISKELISTITKGRIKKKSAGTISRKQIHMRKNPNAVVTAAVTAKPSSPFFPLPPPGPSSTFCGGGATDGASPKTLSLHPDFMSCESCADCEEEEEDGGENNPSPATFNADYNKKEIQTTFQLQRRTNENDKINNSQNLSSRQQEQNRHHETLVLRSLIRAIPGARKVFVPKSTQKELLEQVATIRTHDLYSNYESTITVYHDASVHTEIILHALEMAGYSAFVRNITTPTRTTNNATTNSNSSRNTAFTTNVDNNLSANNNNIYHDNQTCRVRSAFNVQGICCASEIPAVRKIVEPLWGVVKININLTTKVVHVQHNYIQIQASQIAQKLTEHGFPAQIYKDGAATVQFQFEEQNRKHIYSNNKNNNKEERTNYCNAVANILDRIGQSPYVESTLCVEGLRPDQVNRIEKSVADSFIRIQVRAVYPNAISETVKVEHNPELVSIEEIRDFLRQYAIDKDGSFPTTTEVYIDGADANLYLPVEEDYPNHQHVKPHSVDGGCIYWMKIHHVNVWLSGLFWALSMVSLVNGIDWFKYFGLASVLFGLPPIIIKACRTLRRCHFDANCMMVTAALGALVLGEYDEAASVSFLFAVSEFLEASATTKARKAMSEICALRPDHANVIHPISKEIVVVPADRVPLGSLISVRTGDMIAADGIIVEGSTAVDESSLTGESTPAHKKEGDQVSGGTINTGLSQLVVKTERTVEDSAVSRLIRLVEEAQSNRSPTEKMVDAFARSYTPFVIFTATLMCTVPWAFGTDIGREWTLNGLIIIVIACPCALTISTPVTYAAGLAATAKNGVIIKGGAKLEAMGSVDQIVFDKTGTLTKGKFSVTHLEVIGNSKTRQEMLELLSLMQERASHPIAASLIQAAKDEGVNVPLQMSVTDHQILKGEGIMAKVNGKIQVYVGNQRLFNRLGMLKLLSTEKKNIFEEWEDSGGTLGFIGSREDGIIGMFSVKDSVREEAREAVNELQEMGIEAWICTGDSDTTAQAVAKEIGIPLHHVNSQLLPEDKLQFVESLKRPGPKSFALCRGKRYVLFCGDGVNDAPALAAAEIGVSMGEGAAMALEISDVTLMDSRLTKLSYVIQMGQRVLRTVKENIIISFVAKLLVIVLTFVGKMTLLYAIAADVGVMLLVTLNGMKLLPNKSFDLVTPKRSIRGRLIVKNKNRIGMNTNFELVRMKESRSSNDSINSIESDELEIN